MKRLLVFCLTLLFSVTSILAAQAQESEVESLLSLDFEDLVLIEVITVGSRSIRERTSRDFTVPIDIFSADRFNSMGNSADITDNLKALLPSYSATPATGDGSAFVRPTSLRGMAPDQTLVLVNGKRRHRSALVHFFAPAAGNGAHGPDIGMIPSIALDRVEVLRDGAAAQYGSDAIAGVINFIIKDDDEGGEVQFQYGEYFEGEQSIKLAANAGFSLNQRGFVNISLEYTDNEALSRGGQRPDALALIDAGVIGVGSDSPFDDSPYVQTWGRPQTSGTRFFLNSAFELNDDLELYLQGNYADIAGRYRFFYRNPNHSSLVPLRNAGFTGLPAGYTPYLDGDQEDKSMTAGLKGSFDNGTFYDLSINYGKNRLDYFLHNTINPGLGLSNGQIPQRNFKVGGYQQEEVSVNIDFSSPLTKNFNLSYGAEWREETYGINTGEPSSYVGAGASGLAGFTPEDSGEFDRDSYSFYVDLEQDLNEDLLLQYALRYEDFSDFGNTINGKIAGRYHLSDRYTLRGALSTGFHAPTPGQQNIRTTITTFDGVTGLQVEEGLVPASSPLAMAVGGTALKEEKSLNYSLGIISTFSEQSYLSIDFYKIAVDDRIYRTGDIIVPGNLNIPGAGGTISFYTNALDLETQGIDVTFNTQISWTNTIKSDLTFAYNYSEIKVVGQSLVAGINPVNEATIEDIENNYPNTRFVLSANTFLTENWALMLRANYYGKHYDERGRIHDVNNPSAKIGDTIYIDFELSYFYNQKLSFTFGGSNIFDQYVDEINSPNANRQSVGLAYPRRSAANYEGGSWYLKTSYRF